MVGVHPVSEAKNNEFSYDRVICVYGVPAPRVVLICPAVVVQHVIHAVLETFHREGRALGIPFCGVVEDYIKNDFNTCCMKSPYHFFELRYLGSWKLRGSITLMWREECQWVIAPVVFMVAMFTSEGLQWKLMDWHKFNCSNTKTFEIGNFFNNAKICPWVCNTTRCVCSETLYMHFINDRIGQPMAEMLISSPVKCIVYNDTLWWSNNTIMVLEEVASECFRIWIN